MEKCKNTIIGVPGEEKGLSGGERKRLALATEALTDPLLLLCDEPTSGLDSFMAMSVLQVLKRLAKKGKTIILSIHQPSSDIFNLFDKILFVAEGRVAFLGTSKDAYSFFNQLNMSCPSNYNPADYYVQALAVSPDNIEESRQAIEIICNTFETSNFAKNVVNVISESKSNPEMKSMNSHGYTTSWFTQFWVILWRSWLTVLKNPQLVRSKIIQTLV